MDSEPLNTPRFAIGDKVCVIGPTTQHSGKLGAVSEVHQSHGSYRYLVRLDNDHTAVFYGFELEYAKS